MNLRYLLAVIILVISQSAYSSNSNTNIPPQNQTNSSGSCEVSDSKATLISGWSDWAPYEFEKSALSGVEVTGLDIELVRLITNSLGSDIKFEKDSWTQIVEDIKTGKKDITTGATFSKERNKFAYFSTPYRFQEDSIFVLRSANNSLEFDNIEDFLAKVKAMNFKIGVLDGALHGSDKLNSFINDPLNSDVIIKNPDDITNFRSMMKGQIDGFITDKIGGADIIIKNNASSIIEEIPLNIKTPISLMLSRKTISPEFLSKINDQITKLKDNGDYKKIVREYIYPVFLLATIGSDWFYYITLIGVIAFAMSGVAISARDNMTLFGTFLLACLPSFGGGLLRDLFGGGAASMQNATFHICIVLAVVLVGFSFVRILEVFNKDAKKDKLVGSFWKLFLDLTDALGHSAFIVTGVTVAIVTKLSPIEVWGPVFAFLVANGGSMFRDLFTNDKQLSALNGDINAEVSIIWGFIFSIFLKYNADDPDITIISLGVLVVVIGAFLTRLATIYYKIPNIRFR